MVHARRVEEARSKRKSRDAKRARSFDGSSSMNRLEIQDKNRFRKRVSNEVPYKFPKDRDDKGDKPRAKKGRSGNSPNEKPTCAKCGNGHLGECLAGTGNFINCRNSGHEMRDCQNLKGQERGCQVQASGSSDDPKKNRCYPLCSRGDKETSLDVLTCML